MGETIIKITKNDSAVNGGLGQPHAYGAIFYFYRVGVPLLFGAVAFVGFLPHPTLILLGFSLLAAVGCALRLCLEISIELRLLDISVLMLGALILLSGLWSKGGTESLYGALLSFALIITAFLISSTMDNILREQAISVIIASSAASGIVGVLQIFQGGYESGWLDSAAFSGISVRITSLFGNPNVFSAYLLLVIPFVIYRVIYAVSLKKRLLYIALFVLLGVCMIYTWSRGAWLGLALEIFIFFVLYKRGLIPCVLLSLPFFGAVTSLFAPTVWARFVSIVNPQDTSVSYRVSAWNGIMNMLSDNNFFGIGYGESAFLAVYPLYAYSGAVAVRHSHSLYLQILTELGAVGLIIFAVSILAVFFRCFENIKKSSEDKGVSAAVVMAVLGVLFMGLTDYVWYDRRIFLMFWLVVALMGRKESADDCKI